MKYNLFNFNMYEIYVLYLINHDAIFGKCKRHKRLLFILFVLDFFYTYQWFLFRYIRKALYVCNTKFKENVLLSMINCYPIWYLRHSSQNVNTRFKFNDFKFSKICSLLTKSKIGYVDPLRWSNGIMSFFYNSCKCCSNDN